MGPALLHSTKKATFFWLTDHEPTLPYVPASTVERMRGGGAAQRVRIITRPGLSRCEVTRHDLSKLWIAGTGPGGIIVASSLLQLLY